MFALISQIVFTPLAPTSRIPFHVCGCIVKSEEEEKITNRGGSMQ